MVAMPDMVPMPGLPGGGAATSGGLQEVEHVRSVFPETWLWANASVSLYHLLLALRPKDGCPFCEMMPMAGAIGGGNGMLASMGTATGGSGASATPGELQEVEHVRNVFPETWLWTNSSVRC
ncbi:hypothetical protein BaRGS_00016143 [Batillaria attramentaria]|uniref:Uncharacterized protein n=1 Tax=Batillaria attramentaria TaxID=370345 RepID=A0ABD0KZR2_9CAEN